MESDRTRYSHINFDHTSVAQHIQIVTPAPPGSRKGNRITAERWGKLLRTLGYRVTIRVEYEDEPCDVLLALHARQSATSIARFHAVASGKPILLALSGTDLYKGLKSAAERRSLRLATRFI